MPLYQEGPQGWRPIVRWPYDSEEELEAFIERNPDIIGSGRGDTRTRWLRQLQPRAGNYLDLIGVSSDGAITIVECKLGRNREERREVVAQVLEYASALWKMSLEGLETLFRARDGAGQSPFEFFANQDSEWDIDEARRAASANLEHGRFRLVVAVDEVSEKLKKIVEYVNARGKGELQLIAVALPRYGAAGSAVLVPETHGDSAALPSSRTAQQMYPSPETLISTAALELQPAARQIHGFLVSSEIGDGRLTPRSSKTAISYDGAVSGGRTFAIFQLWPQSGPANDRRLALTLVPIALEALGTSVESVSELLRERGFEVDKGGVRIRTADVPRLPDLFQILSREVIQLIGE